MIILQRFVWREQAEIAHQRLEAAGISSVVADDLLFNIHPGISLASGGVRLMVNDEDVEAAREFLSQPPEQYALPPDFVPAETPKGPAAADSGRNGIPYWVSFLAGGTIAFAFLGTWLSLMRYCWKEALSCKGNLIFVFIAGGLLTVLARVCAKTRGTDGRPADPGEKPARAV